MADNLALTPIDHDPFQDLTDYANSLPPTDTKLPGDVHTIGGPAMPFDPHAYMQDPTKPLLGRLATAIPIAIGEQISNAAQGAWKAATLPGDVATGKVDPNSQEAIERSADLARQLTMPAVSTELPDPSKLGIFAGAKSKTADIDALSAAHSLERNGSDPKTIYQSTGWFRGADNNWRYEIPDNTAVVPQATQKFLLSQSPDFTKGTGQGPIAGFIHHPELYKAYPDASRIPTQTYYDWESRGSAAYTHPQTDPTTGEYYPEGITLRPNEVAPVAPFIDSGTGELIPPQGVRSTLDLGLHELQHAIQRREGFQTGSSPQRLISQGLDPQTAAQNYWNNAGEVEARNVQTRMNMTPQERLDTPPWETEDVPRSKQIVMSPVDHDPFSSEPQMSVPLDRDTAFKNLASQQRGDPEAAMLRVQNANLSGGVMSGVVEHLGDLTHRMSELGDYNNFGHEYVQPKVDRVLNALNSPYGFEKEHLENTNSNAKYSGIDVSRIRGAVDNRLSEYAQAHAQLPVYNKPQQLARDAAVAVGNKDFDTARNNLGQLKDMLKDPDVWNKEAGAFDPNYENKNLQSPAPQATIQQPQGTPMEDSEANSVRAGFDPKWSNAPIIDSKGNTLHPGSPDPNQEHNFQIMKDDNGNYIPGIAGYHGSPYDFNKFDVNKVGSGEGSVGDTHGIYFGQKPEVGKWYADFLTNEIYDKSKIKYGDDTYNFSSYQDNPFLQKNEKGLQALGINNGDYSAAKQDILDNKQKLEDYMNQDIDPSLTPLRWNVPGEHEEILKQLDNLKNEGVSYHRGTGNFYQNHLAVDPDNLLDFNKKISDQSPHVKNIIGTLGIDLEKSGEEAYNSLINSSPKLNSEKQVSNYLYNKGIQGTKLFEDRTDPRSHDFLGPNITTHNYVLFHHDPITILNKNRITPVDHDPFTTPTPITKDWPVSHMSSNLDSLQNGFEKRDLGISFARDGLETPYSSPTVADSNGQKGIVKATVGGKGLDYSNPEHKAYIENLWDGLDKADGPYDVQVLNKLRSQGIDWVSGWNGLGASNELHVLNPDKIDIKSKTPILK